MESQPQSLGGVIHNGYRTAAHSGTSPPAIRSNRDISLGDMDDLDNQDITSGNNNDTNIFQPIQADPDVSVSSMNHPDIPPTIYVLRTASSNPDCANYVWQSGHPKVIRTISG